MWLLGIESLNVHKFIAKIKETNTPSLSLFQKKLKFVEFSRSSIFKEVTLQFEVNTDMREFIFSHTKNIIVTNYESMLI